MLTPQSIDRGTMLKHMLKIRFKTLDSKQKIQTTQKDEKLAFQKNKLKMQTCMNPFEQNNDHNKIIKIIRTGTSFGIFTSTTFGTTVPYLISY